ncbi:MAG: transglutaminase domain-containing protein [Planctomycetota bacterium]
MPSLSAERRGPLLLAALAALLPMSANAQPESPYITRGESKRWVLQATVSLSSIPTANADRSASLNDPQTSDIKTSQRFDIEQGTVFWPLAGSAGSYDVDRRSATTEIRFDGSEVPVSVSVFERDTSGHPLHSGGAYTQASFGPIENVTAKSVLRFSVRAETFQTVFDEAAAREVPWPQGDWPREAASAFEPVMFLDGGFDGPYRDSKVAETVRRLTGGDPRSQPPVVTAKWIAGELAKTFRPSGQIVVPDARPGTPRVSGQSVGAIQAFNVTGAGPASQRGRGSPLDLPLLLAACYREAGLPARVVMGYSADAANRATEAFRRSDKAETGPYAWVEFALYDEQQPNPAMALTWVPVDILYMRANNVGRRPFDQPWEGFGTSEQLVDIVPVGYHLHPHNLAATSYGGSIQVRNRRREPMPSLWGWNLVPETPAAVTQTLAFDVTSPSVTASDPERRAGERP